LAILPGWEVLSVSQKNFWREGGKFYQFPRKTSGEMILEVIVHDW
jgi:hypothetical protein